MGFVMNIKLVNICRMRQCLTPANTQYIFDIIINVVVDALHNSQCQALITGIMSSVVHFMPLCYVCKIINLSIRSFAADGKKEKKR